LWIVILAKAGWDFYQHRNFREPVVLGEGVTQVRKLSDYYPRLKNSTADCSIYVLDSGNPGATFLLLGGTHPEEPGANLSALTLVENTSVKQGRLLVVIHANRSASTVTRPGEAYPQFYSIPSPGGGARVFRMGDRWANPLDSWPDPEVYAHFPSRQMLAYMDVRNLNRTWPGRPNGLLVEKTCFAFSELIKKEKVTAVIDLHEAELEYPVISTIVAHEKAAPVAAMVSMMLSAEEFQIGMEYSPKALHGLAHREIGDWLGVPVFQPEAPEPFLDRVRGATG
jgi:predicted deacylase